MVQPSQAWRAETAMNAPFYIPAAELVRTFTRIQTLLTGNEQLLFDAMVEASRASRNPFVPPNTSAEFQSKLREIRRLLEYPMAIDGINLALRLAEELYSLVETRGGLPGLPASRLLDDLYFSTDLERVRIRLTSEVTWVAEWTVTLDSRNSVQVVCELAKQDWGDIVPPYVVGYVHGALRCHEEGFYAVALAMLSIGVEATLRDVLEVRGYTFQHGASAVDVYAYINGLVSVNGGKYTLELTDPTVLPVVHFSSTHASTPIPVKVRRVIHQRIAGRVDLHFCVPPSLPDYWSSATIERPAVQSIGGLGRALDVARNIEMVLNPADLPLDFDLVLQLVRNGLVHLSGQAMATVLPSYSTRSASGSFTLRDFVKDRELVFDFVTNIPRFINDQYIRLRQQGHLASP